MYTLTDVSKESCKYPHLFLGKPSKEDLKDIHVGDLVLLGFNEGKDDNSIVERKFVRITGIRNQEEFEGYLDQNIFSLNPYNDYLDQHNPYIGNEIRLNTVKEGDTVHFQGRHIWNMVKNNTTMEELI